MRTPILLLAAAVARGTLAAQAGTGPARSEPAAARGVASITAQDVARRVHVIAHDSMEGRGTPSAGLEKTAAYIADEFRRLGLLPGGDSGAYLQRYPLEVYESRPESSAVWATGPAPGRWPLGGDIKFVQGNVSGEHVATGAVLVTGSPQAGGGLDSATVSGKVAVVPLGAGGFTSAMALIQLKPAAIIAVISAPDVMWGQLPNSFAGRHVRNPAQGGLEVPPILLMRDTTARAWLARAGAHLDSARAAAAGPLAARALPGVTLHVLLKQRLVERVTAPNVVAILEGNDAALKNEYVVFTAHMDHVGTTGGGQSCAARGADTICNGADDDASGSVAVLELAEAFATAAERPRRSLIFMTVSGEERGLWGSAHWVEHPTVPLAGVVANINNDMVGRSHNFKDSIAVVGREHSDLGATLDRVAAAHPELRMTPVSDPWPQENLFFRSDHFNFARAGIPALFFTSGLHPDYHQVSDTPDKIDAEYEARYAQLMFYLAQEIANAPARPQWNTDSYRRIVQGQ